MNRLAIIFLRLGAAFTFIYAGVASLINPDDWIGFAPVWLRSVFPGGQLLFAFSIYEIALALWLISGKRLFYSSVSAALTVFGIIILNLGILDIVFRDVAILLSAVSLALLSRSESPRA